MYFKHLAKIVFNSLILLAIALPIIGPRDVSGEITSGYITSGSRYQLDDYCVTFREYNQTASVKWYKPNGSLTSSCPLSSTCLVCQYIYQSGSFRYKDCYFYIRNQGREVGKYSVQADGQTYYFHIDPYYSYIPLVLH